MGRADGRQVTADTRVEQTAMGVALHFGADQQGFVRVRIREGELRERFLQRALALTTAKGGRAVEMRREQEPQKEERREEEEARPPPAKKPAVLSRYARSQTRGAQMVAMAKKALGQHVYVPRPAPPPPPPPVPLVPVIQPVSTPVTPIRDTRQEEEKKEEKKDNERATPKAAPPKVVFPLQSFTRPSTATVVKPFVRPRETPSPAQPPRQQQLTPRQQQAPPRQQQLTPRQQPGPRSGLRNLGNTCYLNAVLQALLSFPHFVRALVDLVPPASFSAQPPAPTPEAAAAAGVCAALADLVRERERAHGASLCPERVKTALGRYNAAFAGHQQQDAHELLVVLLDALDAGLRVRAGASAPTPVAATFRAELAVALECRACHAVSAHTEPEHCLSLDVTPVAAADAASAASTAVLDVAACAQAFFRDEPLAHTCAACGCTAAVKRTRLRRAPRVLALHLKRFVPQDAGRAFAKCTRAVAVPPALALDRVLETPGARAAYRLAAAVHHEGPRAASGHYKALVRSSSGDAWDLCDDSQVTHAARYPSPSSTAYILFYELSSESLP